MDDGSIVALYFARSEQAIRETDRKYGGYCYSIAYNILANQEDSEESVNDTYLSAWNSIPPRKPNPLAPFLGKIVRNISIDRWRKNGALKRGGAGSGIILSEDGYILTNNHVISGADKITVYVMPEESDGEETAYEATLIGASETNDIAVLKIDAKGLNAASFGDSDALELGEPAVVIGNPMGKVHGSVTAGIISATERELTIDDVTIDAIQTDAAINPGNSGGALFDEYGNVVGIVYAKSSSLSIEGIGYAIPVNNVKELVSQIINEPESVKAQTKGSQIMLGITIQNVTEELAKRYSMPVGVYVKDVESMSAAERAGIQKGDIIVEFAGETITDADSLNTVKAQQTSGDTVSIKVDRNGKTVELDIVIPQPTEVETDK